MQSLWNWGGEFFGHRDGDDLWTHDGRHVGRFHEDDVYGSDGRYLGEMNNGRLITHRTEKSKRRNSFAPQARRMGVVKSVNYVGYVMLAGYEDFPKPEDL